MDGVIVVNKPRGLSSSDACLKVKRALGFRKVGHLGTLDPMATGVLPLCINEGTKLVQFLMKSEKEYLATMRLGIETDTQDSQGKVLRETELVTRDHAVIKKVFGEFRGELFQLPPMFSALKRNGVPLYKIARKGGSVPREKRSVFIRDLEILEIDIPHIAFRVTCSHGTYIRTLCHDIGKRLNCGAHMTGLERVRNGMFHIQESLEMTDFEARTRNGIIEEHLISPKDALNGMPEVVVGRALEKKIRNGGQVTAEDIAGLDLPSEAKGRRQMKVIAEYGGLIGVVQSLEEDSPGEGGEPGARAWKTLRVFLSSYPGFPACPAQEG